MKIMQTIHTTAHFDSDGSVTLKAPGLASPGDHKVMLVLEDDTAVSREVTMVSEPSFDKVWNNPEDSIYDSL